MNLPVPRGFNDDEMALVREKLILPQVAAFRPNAIVLQCGADAVADDPLAHLSLSNNAHWSILRGLQGLAPRLLVLGGGGYNPWTVARLWTGVWGILAGKEIPDRLPPQAEGVLRDLSFSGNARGRNPPEAWFTLLQDAPSNGPISEVVRHRVDLFGRSRFGLDLNDQVCSAAIRHPKLQMMLVQPAWTSLRPASVFK